MKAVTLRMWVADDAPEPQPDQTYGVFSRARLVDYVHQSSARKGA